MGHLRGFFKWIFKSSFLSSGICLFAQVYCVIHANEPHDVRATYRKQMRVYAHPRARGNARFSRRP